MSERLTVVFDDAGTYRRLKVYSAERGVAMKEVIQEALRAYLGPDQDEALRPVPWDVFDAWQADQRAREREEAEYATDLSDIKKHLYGRPYDGFEEHAGYTRKVAEEPAEYGKQ